MGYSVVPTVATGDLWTAANHNAYIRDNFAAGVPAILTALGDMPYATASRAAGRIPIGQQGEVLKVLNSGIPGWGGPKITHIGQSETNWSLSGTTLYTPNKVLVQMGAAAINNIVDHSSGSITVNFSPAFASVPLIFITLMDTNTQNIFAGIGKTPSNSSFFLYVWNETYSTISEVINWLAIGSPAA